MRLPSRFWRLFLCVLFLRCLFCPVARGRVLTLWPYIPEPLPAWHCGCLPCVFRADHKLLSPAIRDARALYDSTLGMLLDSSTGNPLPGPLSWFLGREAAGLDQLISRAGAQRRLVHCHC